MNGHLRCLLFPDGSAIDVLLMHSHVGDMRGAWVTCAFLGNGGHGDEGSGGGTLAFGGVDAEPCVAGPALPEEPPDGPGPGGP